MDMKRILQAMDNTSTKPVEGANDMAKFLSVVNESKTNRLTTAEQMVMSSSIQVKETITNPVLNVDKDAKPSIIGKYFKTIEQEFAESSERNKDRAKQIAERVTNKLNEAPIDMSGDPNDPTIYGHEKANPMSLKGRILQARAQLKDLAERAESDSLVVWESICRDAKGGMFMGLEQNLEQIRHGIQELAAKRKKGGVQSRGIEKNIGEELSEDWQKVNKKDKTDGMSSKAVKAYRRENPGSKLKTAVTTKPSKLKKGSKSAKRRASFCARMSGMKKAHASAKTKRDPDSPINKALRRWNCESIEEMGQLIQYAEKIINEEKQRLDPKCWDGYKKQGTKMKDGVRVNNCVPKEGVKKGLSEFSSGRDPWDDDNRGDDPYSRPQPEHYRRSIEYFGRFEADHFDDEVFNKKTGEFKGYWDDEEGRIQIAYFKFDNPEQTGSDDPGMGWYYEPQTESLAEGLKDPKDNPCWKGYKPVGTKQKAGKTVPNCVPKEAVQKTGPAGQLRGRDKIDVKGTVLGSPEKSQKGLRGKLVGGS